MEHFLKTPDDTLIFRILNMQMTECSVLKVVLIMKCDILLIRLLWPYVQKHCFVPSVDVKHQRVVYSPQSYVVRFRVNTCMSR